MSEITGDSNIKLSETITLSKAAELLGYDSFRSVNELIKRKVLRAFRPKFSRNKRVLLSDVQALTVMEEIKD